ncbi:MAG: hypothetical protein ABUK08_00300 [Candidatus Humimicrobiaceae bacterium]
METYKEHIKKEYERIFNTEVKEEAFYHFIMIGNEGVEGYQVVNNRKELKGSDIEVMSLRARFNPHRNIECYAFKDCKKHEADDITKKFLLDINAVKFS